MKNLPAEFVRYKMNNVSDYLALNAGLVAMNLVLALTDQGIGVLTLFLVLTNQKLMKFWKSKTVCAELLITQWDTDKKLEPQATACQ